MNICRKNLYGTEKELLCAAEKRAAHLYELTRCTVTDGANALADAPSLFETLTEQIKRSDAADGTVYRRFAGKITDAADKAGAAGFLYDTGYPDLTLSDFIHTLEREPERRGSISYFKGPSTDTAFDVFARKLPQPSIVYSHDFNSSCENVYYGKAEFCILPAISGFYAAAEKYELTGVDECFVTHGDTETRFVLFSGGLLSYREDENLKAEIRIPRGGDLFSVLISAELYGLVCEGVDSLLTDFGASDMITVSGAVKNVCRLLFFLYCMQINYGVTGVYKYENM